MTVGEALAEARTRAGLSVDEVSERTKIRQMVIDALERDDYDACGGDLYVRGYVRVIAGAVGVNAQSLIREYDKSRGGGTTGAPPWSAPEPPAPPAPPAPDTAGRFGRLERLKRLEPIETHEPAEFFQAAERLQSAEAYAPGSGILDLTRAASPEAVDLSRAGSPETVVDMMRTATPGGSGLTRAELQKTAADLPVLDGAPGAWWDRSAGEGSEPGRRRGLAPAVIAVAVLLIAVVIGALVSSSGSGSGTGTSSTVANQGSSQLSVPFAEAYGPNGTADADNPVAAMYPVTSGSTQPWTTQQYTSPQFGGEKTGAGLLLDMGRTVSVSSVAVDLGSAAGTDLQLQAGTSTRTLATVASANNVGGNLTLSPGKPVEARYLMVWITQLPRASDGRYQASVYHIAVDGHS